MMVIGIVCVGEATRQSSELCDGVFLRKLDLFYMLFMTSDNLIKSLSGSHFHKTPDYLYWGCGWAEAFNSTKKINSTKGRLWTLWINALLAGQSWPLGAPRFRLDSQHELLSQSSPAYLTFWMRVCIVPFVFNVIVHICVYVNLMPFKNCILTLITDRMTIFDLQIY